MKLESHPGRGSMSGEGPSQRRVLLLIAISLIAGMFVASSLEPRKSDPAAENLLQQDQSLVAETP